MKVAAFTQGVKVPSARFRVRQYIPLLRELGVDLSEFPSSFGSYPPKNKYLRPLWAAGVLGERLIDVGFSYKYDITFFQREFLSTFTTFEYFTKSPRVLDVDDAIFLNRGGGFAQRLSKWSSVIICGNSFLAENFSQWNKNIFVIPTAVNAEKYISVDDRKGGDRIYIGWIGSSSNYPFLYSIKRPLQELLKKYPEVSFRIVGDTVPDIVEICPGQIEFHPWTEVGEVALLRTFDIGIMPLENSLWARGKCSYKMLQYMSMGMPVVVSPVGMNKEVLEISDCGFSAESDSDWFFALENLIKSEPLRRRLGNNGRECIIKKFSVDVIALDVVKALRAACEFQ